jgi:hypothetical protein
MNLADRDIYPEQGIAEVDRAFAGIGIGLQK